MVIAVLLKVDGGGSATIVCNEIVPDPVFPEKVILRGIQAFSFPIGTKWMHVKQWSIDRDVVINWMGGPLRELFELTPEVLQNGGKVEVPWPPGSLPHADLVSHPEELAELVNQDKEPDPEPPEDPECPTCTKDLEECNARREDPSACWAEPEPEPEPPPPAPKAPASKTPPIQPLQILS